MSPLLTPSLLSVSERWFVVSKPAGWLTIPPSQIFCNSAPPVLSHWVQKQHGPAWSVHRLDRDTSGVVIFARSAPFHQQANDWFQKRQVKKTYYAIASGVPSVPSMRMTSPIRGVPARTQVDVQERYAKGFLAKVRIQTGRRHQIRIHLAQAGYPLWGDVEYGGPTEVHEEAFKKILIPRVALHSFSLELPQGERFEAPFPEDFLGALECLRKEVEHVPF